MSDIEHLKFVPHAAAVKARDKYVDVVVDVAAVVKGWKARFIVLSG